MAQNREVKEEAIVLPRGLKVFVFIKTLERMAMAWMFGTYGIFLFHSGLSYSQMAQVDGVYKTVSLLLDPPTGSLGDYFGQSNVYLAGALVYAVGFLIYGFGHSFAYFAFAEGLSAVGAALISEALEAQATNEFGNKLTKTARSMAQKYGTYAAMMAAVLGVFIGQYFGLVIPMFVAATNYLVLFLAGFILLKKGPSTIQPKTSLAHKYSEVVGILRQGFKEIKNSKQLKNVVWIMVVGNIAIQPFNTYWTVAMAKLGQDVTVLDQAKAFVDQLMLSVNVKPQFETNILWIAFIWIGVAVAMGWGSDFAKKLPMNKINLRMVGIATIWMGAPVIVFLVTNLNGLNPSVKFAICTFGFLVNEMGRGAMRIILPTYTNEHVGDKTRTTTNSLLSSMETLGSALGELMAGVLVLWMSPANVFVVSAGILITSGIVIYKLGKKEEINAI